MDRVIVRVGTRVHPRLTEKMFSRPALDVAVEQDEVDDEEEEYEDQVIIDEA